MDAAHADQQLSQFSIAQAQVGYADRLLLTKTDVAPDCEALIQRLQRMNARAPVYRVTHGDIDLSVLFDIEGFTLNDKLNLTPPAPLFRRIPQPQSDIRSIVVTLERPLPLMQISDVMEGLLLEYADNLLRYKGILSIEDEPRRLLFGACSGCITPTGIGNGCRRKSARVRWCLSAWICPRRRFGEGLGAGVSGVWIWEPVGGLLYGLMVLMGWREWH